MDRESHEQIGSSSFNINWQTDRLIILIVLLNFVTLVRGRPNMGWWFRYSGFWELSGYRGLIEKINNFRIWQMELKSFLWENGLGLCKNPHFLISVAIIEFPDQAKIK